jgi:hypothetical protein
VAAPLKLTRTHRILIALVVAGAVVIAGIGFAGSYSAVRALAERKGFGQFSAVFPIGIDAGICVLLALDLLLTWIRIPFPLLRQTAWLLTLATIAFNGAAAWPNPLGVGMHAVIPVLFVVTVEAARHAVGRIADITADKHMEGVRVTRWLLSPLPTFLLWRRMKLWELRSYEQTIRLEQERLIYQARLRSRFGRAWRRKAPIESLMPLRLARYGVPLAETAPAGLSAAGIEPVLLPPAPAPQAQLERFAPPAADTATAHGARAAVTGGAPAAAAGGAPVPGASAPATAGGHQAAGGAPGAVAGAPQAPAAGNPHAAPAGGPPAAGTPQGHGPAGPWAAPRPGEAEAAASGAGAAPQPPTSAEEPVDPAQSPWFVPHQGYDMPYDPSYDPDKQYEQWYAEQQQFAAQGAQPPAGEQIRVPAGPGRTRPLGGNGLPIPAPRPEFHPAPQGADPLGRPEDLLPAGEEPQAPSQLPDDLSREQAYFQAFHKYVNEHGDFPNARQFGIYLQDLYNVMGQSGGPLTESTLRPYLREFRTRYQRDLDADPAETIA